MINSSLFRKTGKFRILNPEYHDLLIKFSITYYTTALVKDTMVSIKGRSHTSANLDLEINEESKNNKDIVRNTANF